MMLSQNIILVRIFALMVGYEDILSRLSYPITLSSLCPLISFFSFYVCSDLTNFILCIFISLYFPYTCINFFGFTLTAGCI